MIPGTVLKLLRRAHGVLEAGNPRAALKDLEEATRRAPNVFEGWFLLGQAQGMLGVHGAAATCFEKAVRCQPRHAEAWFNLGLSHALNQSHGLALPCFRSAMECAKPSFHMAAACNLAASSIRLNRFDEAARIAWDALHVRENVDLWVMLGVALQGVNDYQGALEAYEKARAMGMDDYTLNLNLGTCHHTLNHYADGARFSRRALERKPGDAVAGFNLASCLLSMGRVEEAIGLLAANPLPQAHHTRLYAWNFVEPYDPARVLAEHRAWGGLVAARALALPPLGASGEQETPRRLGFVSADLREHPVAYFVMRLLESLDRQRFQLFFYNDVRAPDAVTAQLRGLGDTWREIHGVDNPQVAATIRQDGIQILFDLSGHTSERVELFASRLAPVQAAYLGYGASSGLATVDYFVSDEILDPPGQTEGHFVERICRLGTCFATYTPPAIPMEVSPLPMLERGYPMLASFNRLNKVTPRTLALWGAAMAAVPSAQLLVVSRGLEAEETRRELLDALARHGVVPERVLLRGNLAMGEYLELHHEVDLILDCFPWNGHTTTLHALWMGVPTVTVEGGHHAGRFGRMVMGAMGMEEFVAQDDAGFAPCVARILADPAGLARLRAGLRQRLAESALMDHHGLAARFQAACDAMWQERRRGGGPC